MDRSWDMFQVDDGLRLTRNQQKENQETGIPFDIRLDLLQYLVGGFNPSEKYESQWEGLSHMSWKIKNVPNHQPDICWWNSQNVFGGEWIKLVRQTSEAINHRLIICLHGWKISALIEPTKMKTCRQTWDDMGLSGNRVCRVCNEMAISIKKIVIHLLLLYFRQNHKAKGQTRGARTWMAIQQNN